jgi:hypothetical protein
MTRKEEKLKTIYMGYHPRTHDGSIPQSRPLGDAISVMDDFNSKQGEGRFRAEVFEIAYTYHCAVAVMETTSGKVWQYI